MAKLTDQGHYQHSSQYLSLERDITGACKLSYVKHWNNIYSPMAADTVTENTTHREEFEIVMLQLSVGSLLIPQYPIRSHAE